MKKTILIIMAVMFLFSGQVFAFVFGNDSCNAFDACTPGGEKAGDTNTSMGQLIIEAAGYFINSHSDMLKLLNRVEMSELSGLDYLELQDILNSALENMEKAGERYKIIISLAKKTPYNPEIIAKLMRFDYQGYGQKNEVNDYIFSKVADCLSKGDVTGVFIMLKSDMGRIIERLYVVKSSIDAREFPGISTLWRINQDYANAMLGGQYLAEVFNNL